MSRILHILTRTGDPLPLEIIKRQQQDSGAEIVVADLTGPTPDYRGLLARIFEADSVQSW